MKNLLHKFSGIAILLFVFQITFSTLWAQPIPINNGPVGSIINVGENGQIKYWNNTNWISVNPGLPGQSLQFNSGIPVWIVNPQGITTSAVTAIAATTALCGGTVVSNGGAQITARGVCWSLFANPVITDSKTIDGSGIGSFTANLTGLTSNTTYFVRAYATNSFGTAYGNEISFTTTLAPITTVTDVDGNVYDIITIGTQTWLKQNLNTSKFRNGDGIGSTSDNYYWSSQTSGQYCNYNNTPANSSVYGKLYNFFIINDPRHVCPLGWHVPSIAEWNTLSNYAGGETFAGKKLKETGTAHWTAPNASATDEVGFAALPGGYRSETGAYYSLNGYGCFWSSTESNTNTAWAWSLSYYENSVTTASHYEKRQGKSIRCIAD